MTTKRGCRYWFKLLAVGLIGGLLIAYFGYVILSAEAFMQPAHQLYAADHLSHRPPSSLRPGGMLCLSRRSGI